MASLRILIERRPLTTAFAFVVSLCAICIFGCSQSRDDNSDARPSAACSAGKACAGGYLCYYRLGDCSGSGSCFPIDKNPECGIVTSYCGCNGGPQVYGRCSDPAGYADTPSTGENIARCPNLDGGASSGQVDAAADADSTDGDD